MPVRRPRAPHRPSALPPAPPERLPELPDLAALLEATLAARERRPLEMPGRRAAVLVPLYERGGEPHLILTKRTETLAHHRGQVSLPGGRWEDDDVDLRTTALRESEEEIGLPRGRVRVLGDLDDVATIATDFIVTPVVGVVEAMPELVPNPIEIARVMEVRLLDVLVHDARMPFGLGPRDLRYPLDGEDVWGATARILRGLAEVVRDALAAAAPLEAEAARPGRADA